MLTADDILGKRGRIAAQLASYEYRPQQLEMANAVAHALQHQHHLIAEAGTGVGKSFAYLVPAILAVAGEGDERPRRIIVSTHTISLQEQLLQKDVPFLNAVIPLEFSTVLVKGRGNYVSLRRLQMAADRSRQLFQSEYELEQLAELVAWSKHTQDGSLSERPVRPPASIWEEVVSHADNCLGRNCPRHADCLYYKARRRAQHAQILLVNHALFFSDLALRNQGYGILPDYDAVIFDEAHTLESVAGEHMGLKISSGQVQFALNRIYNDHTRKGLLSLPQFEQYRESVDECKVKADEFFIQCGELVRKTSSATLRTRTRLSIENELSPALTELASILGREAKHISDENEQLNFTSAAKRVLAIAESVKSWHEQLLRDTVYWIEATVTRRNQQRIELAAAPIEVGPALRAQLFNETKTVVMTSATLSVGRDASFTFFKSRVGLSECATLQVGSPFDYRKQARLILVEGMPDPQRDRMNYERAVTQMIARYVEQTDGRAFALFTSYDMLRKTASAMVPWLAERNLTLISQADGTPRSRMLELFRENPRSVLFGTESFWQGVDVPGDALQNVIITKLPFSVPDQPLVQARMEAIEEAGGNAFLEYLLPEAIIKMRQGFGRLIRTERDRGIVVILDPRIQTKSYGRQVLQSLPNCEVVRDEYC